MMEQAFLQKIANKIENLLAQYPIAPDRFKEQLNFFNNACKKYWKAMANELPPLLEKPDKNVVDAYEWDPECNWWFPKDEMNLTPDPTRWELDDRTPCYYGILAVIYDKEKSEIAPYRLCEGVLDGVHLKRIKALLNNGGFKKGHLESALKWVTADIVREQEKVEQEKDGQGKKTLEGERSKPMSKSEMMTRVKIDSYKKFNIWANTYDIQKVGENRQLFTIRLDTMDAKTRSKIED